MEMHTIIYEKRRAMGLTQGQVAEYLGVSAPAVHKWEKGTAYPDITLIPKLARLLRTDLNTLFCFRERLTQQEIWKIQEETAREARTGGIKAGFAMAEEKIRQYPDCGALLEGMAAVLEGVMLMSELPEHEKESFRPQLLAWYERAMDSEDEEIKNRAGFMVASKYVQCGNFEKAQQVLDRLPGPSLLNKDLLQSDVYWKTGNIEQAVKLLEQNLLQVTQAVTGILWRLIDLELARGETEAAKQIAKKAQEAATALDTWGYTPLIGLEAVARKTKDVEGSLSILNQMLEEMKKPFHMGQSVLYYLLYPQTEKTAGIADQLLPPLLKMLESDPEYDFLRKEEEFVQLLDRCRRQCERQKNKAEHEKVHRVVAAPEGKKT